MKQSGIDWIGEIPDDWKISKAKTILRNKSIKNHPEAEVLSLYRDLGIVPKNSRDDNHNVTSDDTASYKFVQKGELVLNKMKTWQGSLAVSDYEGIVSPAYYVCEFINQEIDKKYIHYLLRNKMYAQEFERLSTGLRVGQWDLNIDDFLNTPIVYPPKKATQQRIAEYLDLKCAQIDSIIEESKKSIEEYKAWKQSVIFEAVTGKNLNCKKKDSGIEWIGEIPEEWGITTIKQLYNVTLGKMIAPKQISDSDTLENYLCAANIKWLGVNTEVNKQMYFNDSEKEEYLLIPGDVLLMEGGLAGTSCIYQNEFSPCYMQNSVLRCRCKSIGYNKYLYYWIFAIYHLGYIDSICNRATIQHYTKEKVENTPILVNSISEQESITKMLDKKCAEIDSIIAEKESLIADLTEYKKSLIFEVVTGKRSV